MRSSRHTVPLQPLLALIALCQVASVAQDIELSPPPEGQYVLDYAGLIDPEDEQEINEIAAACLAEKVIPIITVTIENME